MNRPERHMAVISALSSGGPMHTGQIAEQIGLCVKRTRMVVCEMRRRGVIRQVAVNVKRPAGGQVVYYEVVQ